MTRSSTPPKHIPTPAQIRAMCERIQAEWSELERQHRRGRHGNCKDEWTPPESRLGDGIMEPEGD